MGEYIEREALIETVDRVNWYSADATGRLTLGAASEEVAWFKASDVFKALEEAPAADVVGVVRCKDCRHSRERNKNEKKYLVEGVLICISPDATDECWNPVFLEHFCSYGERRESDATD